MIAILLYSVLGKEGDGIAEIDQVLVHALPVPGEYQIIACWAVQDRHGA